jgi:hypothetical protein
LFKLDNRGVWIIPLKIQNVAKIGATPTINTLPVVTYDGDILVGVDEQLDELILRCVRILVLIYHDVSKLPLPLFAYLVIGL